MALKVNSPGESVDTPGRGGYLSGWRRTLNVRATGGEMDESLGFRALLDQVREGIERRALIRPGDRVLAAISGGLDSMVMLDILDTLAPEMGFSLAAAALDHGLRGEQGQTECALVDARAAELGLPFRAGRVDTGEHARKNKLTVQEAARELRYQFLREAAADLACNRLATAHHRDDQAETVLLRLLSGSGFAGLAAMRRSSEDGFIIRPLLDVPRAMLETYARQRSLAWIEDPSNSSVKYLRNRLRMDVIPSIERRFDQRFREHLASLADQAAELTDRLDEAADSYRDRVVGLTGEGLPDFDCAVVGKLPALVRRRLMRRAVYEATGGKVILSGRPLAALEELAVHGSSGRSLDLPGKLRAVREFDRVRIESAPSGPVRSNVGTEPPETALPRRGRVRLRVGESLWEIEVDDSPARVGLEHPVRREPGGREEVFDSRELKWPLSAGAGRTGESVVPFGLDGSKKLKKVFLEKRVPLSRRRSLPVVRDGDGRVLWVCTLMRSNLATVTPETVRTVTLRAVQLQDREFERANQH